jgi:glycosyltransferase involved in cell wall biosynthesis
MKNSPPELGMILKGWPRISETFISNEIGLLEESGYRIRIFSMRKPRENFTHAAVAGIKAEVLYLPSTLFLSLHRLLWPNLCVALKNPGPYAKALSLAWKRFLRNKKIATLKHVFQAGFLMHHGLSKGNVQHLHAHFAHSPCSVAMFASILSGIPFSFTGHAKDIYTSNKDQLAEKIAAAKFVVTCTEYNRQYLLDIAPRSTHIHRNYHGINVRLFRNESPRIETAPPYRLFTVARMVEKKGLSTVVAALAELKKQGLPFTWTLVGEGDLWHETRAAIREAGIEEMVTLAGTLTHEEVLQLFKESDLFVLGCRIAKNGDRDGVPNVLVESLAMGVPVVATTVSGIPELVEHEKTGLLVPPDDPSAMADAFRRLLTDQELRSRVIPEGETRVREHFDNRKHIMDLVRIYKDEGVLPAETTALSE